MGYHQLQLDRQHTIMFFVCMFLNNIIEMRFYFQVMGYVTWIHLIVCMTYNMY